MIKSRAALVSLVLSVCYFMWIYVQYIGFGINSNSAIAIVLILPHMAFLFLGIIFNLIGYCKNRTWAMITTTIFYVLSAFAFILYAAFLLPSIVLAFIGIDRINVINNNGCF